MLKHSEHGHSIEEDHHDDCLETAENLLEHLVEGEYPEHVIKLVEGLIGELEEYSEEGESDEMDGHDTAYEDNGSEKDEENPDEELNKYAEEELNKKMGKPLLKIEIRSKKK